ncbi:uncharacterized protein [Polyergus mexicanus]|uniref:uncharacterized protein n=1 Tax=Polyergus mexicanus TaxID=615972 RepID=UPI0038B557F1
MRFAVTLCFLATLSGYTFGYTIDASPALDNLEKWRLQVRNAKSNVDDITRQLKLLRTDAEEDTITEVTEKGDEEQRSFREYKNLLLKDLKKVVNNAKEAGKDVNSCYEEANTGIDAIEDAIYNDATKCNNAAQNSIENDLGFIDNLISTGNEVLSDLDGIFLTCHDSDTSKRDNCIVTDLARINADIKVLRSQTTSAEITIVYVFKNVVLQATNCLNKAYSSVHSMGDLIKMRLVQCIETIQLTTTTTTITSTEATSTEATSTKAVSTEITSNVNSKPNDQHLISKTDYIMEQNGQNEIFSQNLEITRLKVKDVIWKVESIIQQFAYIRIETKEDTATTVTEKWWDQMDNYKDLVNHLFVFMRREINNAKAKDKAKDKDIQRCYDINSCAINKYGDTAYKAAEKCVETAESSIEKSLGFIDDLTLLGKTLITELDELSINCHNSDSSITESCVLTELARINIAVKTYEENAKYVKFNALSASNYVVLQASKCLNNIYTLAGFESKGASSSNSGCIQNVLKNKKNIINNLKSTCKLRLAFV